MQSLSLSQSVSVSFYLFGDCGQQHGYSHGNWIASEAQSQLLSDVLLVLSLNAVVVGNAAAAAAVS